MNATRPAALPRPTIEGIPRQGEQPLYALPAFLPPAAERRHRRQRLAAAFRLFSRLGYEVGLAGHFTARDPILTDHFWVNPLGMSFAHIRASDLLLVAPDGRVVEGVGMVNITGVPYHDQIQAARPAVIGIAHAHAFHAKIWSAFGRVLPPITADAASLHDDQVVFEPRRPEGMEAQAARRIVAQQVVAALGERNILIWQNHGHWTTGDTVEAAAWRFIAFDDAARGQLLAQAAGQPIVPEAPTRSTASRARAEVSAWLSFLPLWDRVVREEPDLLD
ncbi:Decarboxylase NovR [Roseomonas sp. TAS13]|uniref:class II aldolase/adducin family protein n=1 Tax=Roseomonas sp. TAS13 TaxID=1926319 RepID=UPI000959469E|nr:class II aldolase/adducin family protein [Roseomonas sp. TAS13]USQ74347.1 class II aldolase/adducin family protein [Roseomonas mucosa]GAV34819.1 Decarboxylase NovR [Roseomonas sp. TAS13]